MRENQAGHKIEGSATRISAMRYTSELVEIVNKALKPAAPDVSLSA